MKTGGENCMAANDELINPRSWRSLFENLRRNKVIYDQINGVEKGEETTTLQKPLKLGNKKKCGPRIRKKLRFFRIRVSRIRIRVKICPMQWLKKFIDSYAQMMIQVQEQLGGGGGLVMGFQSMYPARAPSRARP